MTFWQIIGILYLIVGFFIVKPDLIILSRKIRISLKYNKINYTMFFRGALQALIILLVFFGWVVVLIILMIRKNNDR